MIATRNVNARVQAGIDGKAKTSAHGFSVIAGSGVKRAPSIIVRHFCTCRAGAVCICCLSWNRTIRGHEARRSDNLRRQDLGGRMRAVG